MNKRIFFVALVIISAGFLYKRSLKSMESTSSSSSSIQPGGMVTLLSSDNVKFQIPQAVAEQSPMLKAAFQPIMHEKKIGLITLQNISADILGLLVNILRQLPTAINVDNLIINTLDDFDPASLAHIADASVYLGLDKVTDSIMRLYIFKSLETNRNATSADLKTALPENAALQSAVDRLFEFVKCSAGFVALNHSIFYLERFLFFAADRTNITNLYGLSLIQNKENITDLELGSNQISEVPLGSFDGFTKLNTIDLSNNDISQLPEQIFQELRLVSLDLKDNKLEKLPEKIFHGQDDLGKLNLRGNELRELPQDIFKGLANLLSLNLGHNKLQQLPQGIFNDLTSLESLLLEENPLSLTPDQIKQEYLPAGNTTNIRI